MRDEHEIIKKRGIYIIKFIPELPFAPCNYSILNNKQLDVLGEPWKLS
jgi:hypothetical protein